jgi:L-ribulose-5-phosphate 3-epimerase UlaE
MSNQVESINSASNKRIHLLKTNSDALLVSNIDYALNAGNLIISARVSLYPKATNLKKFMKNSKDENTFDMTDIDNTIYNKNFTFTKQSISVSNIKNSLNEGAKNISEQIIDDLSHPI